MKSGTCVRVLFCLVLLKNNTKSTDLYRSVGRASISQGQMDRRLTGSSCPLGREKKSPRHTAGSSSVVDLLRLVLLLTSGGATITKRLLSAGLMDLEYSSNRFCSSTSFRRRHVGLASTAAIPATTRIPATICQKKNEHVSTLWKRKSGI